MAAQPDTDTNATILAVAVENAELRAQLAEAQELLIGLAVDGGEQHARIEALQAELAQVRDNRDTSRAEALRQMAEAAV
ncbi:hypothetical protein [Methylobacterium sp. WL7]|uniref:hypothetical protein n=1 Tax=Methylobacterium sp. WL7 TaxID=2603900 RepID=UPI0011C92037|nr:hypothetical protein [Methylobacterium sp. WL7]TXN46306.1 hypothetical protein FV233_08230 [Methylobacterium sp. WL7]